jgi:hypothetical protein
MDKADEPAEPLTPAEWKVIGGTPLRTIATATRTVVVPGTPGVRIDEPLDLGTIALTASP